MTMRIRAREHSTECRLVRKVAATLYAHPLVAPDSLPAGEYVDSFQAWSPFHAGAKIRVDPDPGRRPFRRDGGFGLPELGRMLYSLPVNTNWWNSEMQQLMLDNEHDDFLRSVFVIEKLVDEDPCSGAVRHDARQRPARHKVQADGILEIRKQAGLNLVEQIQR